ncbi:MAG: porin family protein [Chitinispirillia bacterium]|nr:porin family protein [Chitinispirillia bacterium]
MRKIVTSPRGMLKAVAAAITVMVIAAPVRAQEEPAGRSSGLMHILSDAYVLPGLYAAYNVRDGYRKYDGVDQRQLVERSNLFTFGLSGGKRFELKNPRLRLQTTLETGYGIALEEEYDEYPTNIGDIAATLNSHYWVTGVQADIQRLFPSYARTYFISAGAGVYLTCFYETVNEKWSGDKIDESDGGTWTFSPGVNIGAGMEYKIAPNRALSVSYNLRILMSTNYDGAEWFFPMGVNYTEFFYSHMLQVQFLIPARDKRVTVNER